MNRLFVAVLLIAFMATSAYGVEINAARAPEGIASATSDSVMVTSSASYGIPNSIIAFTGSGDEFFVEFWGNWDSSADNVYTWSTPPLAVPGAMTLPRISQSQMRADDLFHTGWRFYCATDSISVIMGDK